MRPQSFSRRTALKLGAAVSLLPPSLQEALASPPRPGGLRAVEHVVFLMQENRSFDHYYGSLRGVRGFGDRNALELPNGRSVFDQGVLPFAVRDAANRKDIQYIGDLDHSWEGGHKALNGGWNNGWVAAKTAATMAYYDRKDLPFHYELADTFTICDAYHCSVPSSTSPNRNYWVSGYTGFEANGKRAIGNDAYAEDKHPGYSWMTYPQRLGAAGHSWRVYQEWDNFQDNNLEFFAVFKDIARKVLPKGYSSLTAFYDALPKLAPAEQDALLAQLDSGVRGLSGSERELYERALRRVRPKGLAASFRADVLAGRLPKVSYLVPSSVDSEHPGASSPASSANLTYDVLDALASNVDVWSRTALFITYDENDGYFDHVAPPRPPESVTDEYFDGKPIGFGPRVPMTVVSPWTVGGFVCSQTFDHTSMIRFVERWLGVREPNISAWRRTVSGDLTSAFDFTRTTPRPTIRRPAPVPPFTGRWRPTPPASQSMPVQEPGTRRARALPYQPDAFLTGSRLTLRNTGSESVHLALYSYVKPEVRHFDVRGVVVDSIRPGDYRFTVLGPNGFRREFAGVAGEPVSVSSAVSAYGVELVLAGDVTFVVRSGGKERRVRAGRVHLPRGSYDVEVTAVGVPGFRRRLTGCTEDGSPSWSGAQV
ncbi:phospholipase C, phosphocholine-specific [Allokutzneria sp. A3M-2-11 16]|uniref:phosphocholine-specific phospholipase C n=1 Tax=Allokutzneria sp. A3M-2-11 16 TaxID=2962043 RepID=UPI0020B7DCBB|nr:phospholipase C, phosphocholine-specific [Allokutzneria sp. A3M-2-11 16]MCP3801435.1 phospholipase C, phosphocholine-specific [Allokutzneria sp. A3M-2-11 16]